MVSVINLFSSLCDFGYSFLDFVVFPSCCLTSVFPFHWLLVTPPAVCLSFFFLPLSFFFVLYFEASFFMCLSTFLLLSFLFIVSFFSLVSYRLHLFLLLAFSSHNGNCPCIYIVLHFLGQVSFCLPQHLTLALSHTHILKKLLQSSLSFKLDCAL